MWRKRSIGLKGDSTGWFGKPSKERWFSNNRGTGRKDAACFTLVVRRIGRSPPACCALEHTSDSRCERLVYRSGSCSWRVVIKLGGGAGVM